MDVTQVGMAIATPRRRADRDEYRVGAPHRVLEIETEIEPSRGGVARDKLVETRFVDRDFAASQRRDLVCILVDASDEMAEIGKACTGHQPDISCPNHRDAHAVVPIRSMPILGKSATSNLKN
jgi:TPP-dependent pyruvate/acetoin dehydrogenase alpha subunit